MVDWAILATIIVSMFGGGGVASVIVAWKGAKKSDLDVLRGIIKELRDDNEAQRTRIDELEVEVNQLRTENRDLRQLLSDHGIDPEKRRQRGLFVR